MIETKRLLITKLKPEMAKEIYENSLDDDTKRFVPDEVYESIDDAKEVIEYLIQQYSTNDGPLVYAIIQKDTNKNLGYIQLVPLDDGTYEVGYHIGKKYTGNGYASEALKAFLPFITKQKGIKEVYGICHNDNLASKKVLEKCDFKKIFEGISEYQGEDTEVVKYLWQDKK